MSTSAIMTSQREYDELKAQVAGKDFITVKWADDDFTTKIWMENDKLMAEDAEHGVREIIGASGVELSAEAKADDVSPFGCIVKILLGPEFNYKLDDVLEVMAPLKSTLNKLLDGLRVQYSNDIPKLREKMHQTMKSLSLIHI